jgi:hypothetical protein
MKPDDFLAKCMAKMWNVQMIPDPERPNRRSAAPFEAGPYKGELRYTTHGCHAMLDLGGRTISAVSHIRKMKVRARWVTKPTAAETTKLRLYL